MYQGFQHFELDLYKEDLMYVERTWGKNDNVVLTIHKLSQL